MRVKDGQPLARLAWRLQFIFRPATSDTLQVDHRRRLRRKFFLFFNCVFSKTTQTFRVNVNHHRSSQETQSSACERCLALGGVQANSSNQQKNRDLCLIQQHTAARSTRLKLASTSFWLLGDVVVVLFFLQNAFNRLRHQIFFFFTHLCS